MSIALPDGEFGDKLGARRLITLGILASALLNVSFGFLSALPLMVALWCAIGCGLKGYSLSLGRVVGCPGRRMGLGRLIRLEEGTYGGHNVRPIWGVRPAFSKVPDTSPTLATMYLGAVGFTTFGAHTTMATALPMDYGTRKAASSAAGFIDGLGYLGATIAGVGTGWLVDNYG